MDPRSNTVSFSVGGKAFEVMRQPTLSLHPTCLLTQLAEDGIGDAAHPIFVEANQDLFPYILDYLRFRKIHIPVTVSVAAMLREATALGLDLSLDDVVQENPLLGKLRALTEEAVSKGSRDAGEAVQRCKVELLAAIILQKLVQSDNGRGEVTVHRGSLDQWARITGNSDEYANIAFVKNNYFDGSELLRTRLQEKASEYGYTVEVKTFTTGRANDCQFDSATFKPAS